MPPVQESFMRLIVTLVVCVPPLAYLNYYAIKFQKAEAEKLALIVSGQEATISWDGIYQPWKEAKLLIPDYPIPIKTTYTFWLGAFGEIND